MSTFRFAPGGHTSFDGRWFPVTWNNEVPAQRAINAQDIQELANHFDVPANHIDAILHVEAGRHGFLLSEPAPARPKILFEAHHFYRRSHLGREMHKQHPNLSSPHWDRSLYKGGSGEWDRLTRAASYDLTAALLSASWGLGQVMGFNWLSAGSQSLEHFVVEEFTGEREQLGHMIGFIEHNGLLNDLRKGNWAHLARGYNGAAYRANRYDDRLAEAARHSEFA